MERDPFNYVDDSPEKRWGFFEKEDNPEKLDTEEKATKWFEQEEKEEKPKKPTKKELDSKEKPEKQAEDLPASDSKEFKDLPKEQQKHVLAKEYVQARAAELEEELELTPPNSPEAAEIIADLELISALEEKLDNPELEVEEAVELAYQQIMERLDEILADDPQETEEETIEEFEEEPAKPREKLTVPPLLNPLRPRRASPQKPTTQASASKSPSGGSDSGRVATTTERTPTRPLSNTPEQPTAQQGERSKEAIRKRRAGKLAVSEALSQMLGSRYEATEASKPTETVPVRETPERVINPIRRSIAEKEQKVRRLATNQVVEAPFIDKKDFEQPAATPNIAPPPEHPGVRLEPVRVSMPELRQNQNEQSSAKLSKETVRNLQQSSTPELLKLANNVTVEGTTLRRLFETNQIDRSGLIKVLKEALKGGDIKGALAKSKLGKEAQRGRAIEMRHDDPMILAGTTDSPARKAATEERSQQLLAALESVKQQTTGVASTNQTPGTPLSATAIATQKANAAKRRAVTSVVVAATAAVAGATALLFFLL